MCSMVCNNQGRKKSSHLTDLVQAADVLNVLYVSTNDLRETVYDDTSV